jgi:hypothetical protein
VATPQLSLGQRHGDDGDDSGNSVFGDADGYFDTHGHYATAADQGAELPSRWGRRL